jgi:hypothetical protein
MEKTMTKNVGFGSNLYLAAGFGLFFVGRQIGLRGDLAPYADHGVSSERLYYHGIAALMMIGALACFVPNLLKIWRLFSGGAAPQKQGRSDLNAGQETFDADAAIARYLKQKADSAVQMPPSPTGSGFGRKRD